MRSPFNTFRFSLEKKHREPWMWWLVGNAMRSPLNTFRIFPWEETRGTLNAISQRECCAIAHRECFAIARRECFAIALQHVQVFPLRRNRGIITKSDRPKGVLRDRLSVRRKVNPFPAEIKKWRKTGSVKESINYFKAFGFVRFLDYTIELLLLQDALFTHSVVFLGLPHAKCDRLPTVL